MFGDLEANLTRILARDGFRHDIEAVDLGDELVWVVGAAQDVSDTVHRSKPVTKADLAAALDQCTAADSGHGPSHIACRVSRVPGSLTLDAHPCEGPGSDPQDVLPDDRAWGSRTHPPDRP